MRRLILYFFLMIMIASSCKTGEAENPFFKTWETAFQVPPFELIQSKHFLPAFQEGISQQESEIEAIVSNTEAPDFFNTLEALEYSGLLLSKVGPVFYNLLSSLTNDELQNIAKEVSPLLSSHSDNISLNPDLFARIQVVYEGRENLDLNPEQAKLLEETYKRFVRGGAALEEEKQERFREINQRLSILTLQFGDNVLAETNRFQLIIDNEADLSGLPQAIRDAAAESARNLDLEGKWVFTLHGPSLWPFLQYAENRDLREKMQTAYANRGNNNDEYDNKEIISEIVSLRLERAQMLGFSNHAEFILAERMAKNSETVDAFLMRLWPSSVEMARKEAAEFQEMINREGEDFQLQAWDWWFYAEKLRKEKFDLEEEVLRPYFELESVKQGIFLLCEKLFGLQFVPQKEIPAYHQDVQAYEVTEEDGTHIGIIYMDFFPRESKRGGAWMSSFREQSVRNGEFIHPVVTINGNFSRPVGDQPALLSYDEMLTFFHEFGHALHGLLANTTYPSLSGTNVTWDFVELPSQIMENWASDPEFLKLFARHYQTGEAIPEELLNKLKESSLFNQGFANTEYLAASFLDMSFHTYERNEKMDVASFEKESMSTISLIPEIIPRYRSTYFSHIFSGGYSAGYYSYRWAEVLDSDAYEAFRETGLFDSETANRFREFILEKGGTEDPMELYVQFRGRKPDEKPFLKKRGLL